MYEALIDASCTLLPGRMALTLEMRLRMQFDRDYVSAGGILTCFSTNDGWLTVPHNIVTWHTATACR